MLINLILSSTPRSIESLSAAIGRPSRAQRRHPNTIVVLDFKTTELSLGGVERAIYFC